MQRGEPALNVQQLLHEGQQCRDEAEHGATEHEYVFAEVFRHEAAPLQIVSQPFYPRRDIPASKSPEADRTIWSF